MPKIETTPSVPMRVLKISNFPSLSGRSQLTGHIGCDTENAVHFRVVANTGSGQFNADWVQFSTIEKLLAAQSADMPISSRVLLPIFQSKSSNSPAFLFAALLAEGLVNAGTEKNSGYLLGDIEGFRKAMSTLIATGTDLMVAADTPSEPPKTKRPAKTSAK